MRQRAPILILLVVTAVSASGCASGMKSLIEQQNIQIQEIVGAVQPEVIIAEIAPAQYRDPVVGHDDFIVHAKIKPLQGLLFLLFFTQAILLQRIKNA